MRKMKNRQLKILSALLVLLLLINSLSAAAFAENTGEFQASIEQSPQNEAAPPEELSADEVQEKTEPTDISLEFPNSMEDKQPEPLEDISTQPEEADEEYAEIPVIEETETEEEPDTDSPEQLEEELQDTEETKQDLSEENPVQSEEVNEAEQSAETTVSEADEEYAEIPAVDETETEEDPDTVSPESSVEDLPEEVDEPELSTEPEDDSGEMQPTWSIQIPDNPPIEYRAEIVTLSAAIVVNAENIGDSTIYLTITSNCVFAGSTDEMPIMMCVDGVPIAPGKAVVYGTVTSEGAYYAPITLVFNEEDWEALSSGSYCLDIQYDSYVSNGCD